MTTQQDLRAEVRNALAGLDQTSGETSLLNLCLDAVQTVDEAQLRIAERVAAPFRPQMLLTLLTYSYVKGLFDSRDIAAATGDRNIRYIVAGTRPAWTDLRRFRRAHRELLAQTLAWVFKQAWALKLDAGEASFRSYEWFETELGALIGREAATRLETAALMDGSDSE